MADLIQERKAALRTEMKRRRADITILDHRTKSTRIATQVQETREWRRAERIFIYVSAINNEVDTLGLIFSLFDEGKSVFVPRCAEEPGLMHAVRITSLDELRPTRLCLMEPPFDSDRIKPASALDLIVAPLLAFDQQCRRLGMGGGYYDAFISEAKCPVVGLAFSFQQVPEVPVGPDDKSLDVVVTDTTIIRVPHE
jgi:5-formyltetrahydrofolate cyclo-ligase